jgi:hypothetical protein
MAVGIHTLKTAEIIREELRRKNSVKGVIESPSPNTSYNTDSIDLGESGSWSLFVYSPDGSPLTVQIEMSDDGVTFKDLVGYTISSSDYSVDMWNNISEHKFGFGWIRARITTGATAPTRIKWVILYSPV